MESGFVEDILICKSATNNIFELLASVDEAELFWGNAEFVFNLLLDSSDCIPVKFNLERDVFA
jgi:hypothetical protein